MNAYDIIIRPIVTEKSMDDMAERKYTFKVNIVKMPGKKKRQGMIEGRTSDWKKAIVKLKEGSKQIEFFEGLE